MELRLPSEYQEVEYIENTGTQYIITDLLFPKELENPKIEWGFMQIAVPSGDNMVFGYWSNGSIYYEVYNSTALSYASIGKNHYDRISNANLTKDIFIAGVMTKETMYLNGYSYATNAEDTIDQSVRPMAIFAWNSTSGRTYTNKGARIYYLRFFDGNTKMADYVPCYRKSDGEIGMYDTVTKTFYTNSGADTFLKGADITRYIDNVSVLDTRRKILLNTPHIDTSVGDLVTFNTDLSAPLKSCKVSFLPVQEGEGDPSSDNIRPISGWTGVNIYDDPKYGGNIVWNQCLDLSTITISSSSSSVLDVTTTETGFNVALNDDVSTTGSRVVYFSIKWNRTQNHRYIFLCKISNTLNYSSLYFYHSNGSTNREYSSDAGEQFFGWESYDGSTSETKTTLRLYIYGIDMKAGESFEVSNLMAIDLDEMFGTPVIDELYENTTTSTQKIEWFKNIIKNYNYYEYNTGEVTTVSAINGDPYTSISINWTDNIGIVYGGYVDLVSGELVVDKAMKTFDGSETWNSATVSSKTVHQTRRPADIASGAVFTSNIITRVASLSGTVPDNVGYFGGTYLNIYAPSLSVEEWVAMLTATPLQIVYKLAEPIHYILTPQQLTTFRGINNIFSDANGQTEIKYWKH